MRRICLLSCLLSILFASSLSAAESNWESLLSGFNLGLGGTVITNEYKDMQGDSTVLPLLGYEGEYLYLRGVAGGIHFYRNQWLEMNAQISYLPQHFYADDSDDWAIRRLDDRYTTLMGGFNGRMILPLGILGLTVSTDLLGYSNGVLLDSSYTYPLAIGALNIAPTVGIQWTDANYNNYYYGVDNDEAARSGLEAYDPDGSLSPYVQMTARYNFNEKWSAFGSARALFLNEEIYNSPMVERCEKYSFSLGAMYSF